MTTSPVDEPSQFAPEPPARSGLAIVLGAVLALALVGGGLFLFFRTPPLPGIEQAKFDEAQRNWNAAAIEDYHLEVRVDGAMPATYRVEVRAGNVIAASMNGRPQTQQRTWSVWTVPGMFSIIRQDLAGIEKSGDSSLILRGQFDPATGLPRSYQRISLNGQAEVRWEVTQFERLPATANSSGANPSAASP